MTTKKKDPAHILPPSGGPPKVIDWAVVKALCNAQCTQAQIAHAIPCAISTLIAAVEREQGTSWEEFYDQHRQGGLASLRQAQFTEAVEKKNTALLIFLGKNMLGQSDRRDVELSGKNGGPIETRELPATDNWLASLFGNGTKETPPASGTD